MFLGLGATLLACFNFTGNVTSTGQLPSYTTFVQSTSIQDGVDYHLEYVNDYSDMGTYNVKYYLQYDTNLYQYLSINFSFFANNSAQPRISFTSGGANQNRNVENYSFDTYIKMVGYDEDNFVLNTYLITFRNYDNYYAHFDTLNIDYSYFYRFTIDFTIAPYTQSMYNLLTSLTEGQQDYQTGYDTGYQDGYRWGYEDGQSDINLDVYQEGYDAGYGVGEYQGYQQGYAEGQQADEQMTTIFANIFQVAMVPVNFFLAIFNYEIFGINLSSFVSALLTIAVIVILFRTITGGSAKDD